MILTLQVVQIHTYILEITIHSGARFLLHLEIRILIEFGNKLTMKNILQVALGFKNVFNVDIKLFFDVKIYYIFINAMNLSTK